MVCLPKKTEPDCFFLSGSGSYSYYKYSIYTVPYDCDGSWFFFVGGGVTGVIILWGREGAADFF